MFMPPEANIQYDMSRPMNSDRSQIEADQIRSPLNQRNRATFRRSDGSLDSGSYSSGKGHNRPRHRGSPKNYGRKKDQTFPGWHSPLSDLTDSHFRSQSGYPQANNRQGKASRNRNPVRTKQACHSMQGAQHFGPEDKYGGDLSPIPRRERSERREVHSR